MKKLLIIPIIIFLSACSSKNAPVDKHLHKTSMVYRNVSYSIDKGLKNTGGFFQNLKDSFFESSIGKFVVSDKTLAKNRKNYITWKQNRRYVKPFNRIIKDDPKRYTLSRKMNILSDYFMDIEKKRFLKDFRVENPKPQYDEFLTTKENLRNIYKYKEAVFDYNKKWNLNLDNTKKKVSQKVLYSLYGKPRVKDFKYNADDEEVHLQVYSKHNGFMKKVVISADKNLAKKIKNNMQKVKAEAYYKLDDNRLDFIGINILFDGKYFLADISEKDFIRDNRIEIMAKNTQDLNLQSEDINYRVILKDLTPPSWFNTLQAKPNQVIGYGVEATFKAAKLVALSDIAQSVKVKVKSSTSFRKSLDDSSVTKKASSDIDVESENIELENTKVIKSEKKDGLWFVAVSWDRGN